MHSAGETGDLSRITVRMNQNANPLENFMRTSSLDRSNIRRSWRPASIILSGTTSNLPSENIPSEMARLAGGVVHRSNGGTVEGGATKGSLSRTSSMSSWGKGSISLRLDAQDGSADSVTLPLEIVDKTSGSVSDPREIVNTVDSLLAQIGDRGSRGLGDKEDDEGLLTLSDDALLMFLGSQFDEPRSQSPLTPLTEEIISPIPSKPMLNGKESSSVTDKKPKLPMWLDLFFYLSYLAVFGMLGVLTRYYLKKLFGPNHLALTGNSSPSYLDLPSNILGSFLMGWFGVVFKEDINHISPHLMVGLSTGYLGSLTTFSGWNQGMVTLSSKGKWVYTVAGFIVGMCLVHYSIIFGVECAKGFRNTMLKCLHWSPGNRMDHRKLFIIFSTVILSLWCMLWALSGAYISNKLSTLSEVASLWLAFFVGPPGVWIRWRLAMLNGQGLGRKRILRWLPFGTLSANILAACIMAALSTIDKAVKTQRGTLIISGLQLGFLGCLSTVSTFVAEVYAMALTGHRFRAFIYSATTIVLSFALGTVIYSVPVWMKHYS